MTQRAGVERERPREIGRLENRDVSAVASREDPRAQLARAFPRAKWIGDLLHCPYSETAPVHVKGAAAITLYDFAALKKVAEDEGKHVVVVSAPCSRCGRGKVDALLPLLATPELRAWNYMVVSLGEGKEILKGVGRAV